MSSVRRIAAADARRCAEVHVESWRAGYRGIVPGEYLEALTVDDRLSWWESQALAQPAEARLHVFVAEDDYGVIRGFGSGCPSEHGPGDLGQVAQLYLDPAAWGSGLASLLMDAVLDDLRARGFRRAQLSVARDSPRPRRFYEREGWTATGVESNEFLWGVHVATTTYQRTL